MCGLVPGVMAQTGMECLEIIKGVVSEVKPDFVVTIDALAARSTKRLGCTIQLTDTGIVPGSGVGTTGTVSTMAISECLLSQLVFRQS